MQFNSDTLARFGSCAKAFTALAILLLDDEEKLSIYDSIAEYLPLDNNGGKLNISIHHLMKHTSAIPYVEIERNGYSREEFLRNAMKIVEESNLMIGAYEYSNINYSLLQMIIENVTSQSFDDVIRQLILKPLEMNRTLILGDDAYKSNDRNHAIPYDLEKINGQTHFIKSNYKHEEYIKGPGFLISSCNEMMNFIEILLNKGCVNGKQIFKPSVINQLLTKFSKDEVLTNYLKCPSFNGYGNFGIKCDYKGQTFINGGGSIEGGVSLMGLYREAKVGFACVWNSLSSSQIFVYDLWDEILEQDLVFKIHEI